MIMRRRMMARRVVAVGATTAVVAGTAGAVRHHQDQKYANQAAEQQGAVQSSTWTSSSMHSRPQLPLPPAAAPANDLTSQLNQLAQLHASGVLSDAEFAAAKQKLLSGS